MAAHLSPLAERATQARTFLEQDAGLQPAVGSVQHFAQDREIFAQGDDADYFFKLVSGVVRTCKFLADGRRQIDAFYVAGDLFGFEPGAEHRLAAEAVADCTVIAYRKIKTDPFAGTDRHLSRELLDFAMRGMTQAQNHSLLLGRRSAMEKVAGFLLDWAQRSTDHRQISLAMTRQDIADYLGLTIETVSRSLTQFERDGVIALPCARQVEILDTDALEDLAA